MLLMIHLCLQPQARAKTSLGLESTQTFFSGSESDVVPIVLCGRVLYSAYLADLDH